MMQSAELTHTYDLDVPIAPAPRRLSFARFFLRYPIFLLAFGPPVIKAGDVGDTSQAHFGLWNVLQVTWLTAIALRAFLRLTSARSIHIPKRVRSILRLSLILGILFILSVSYSPGFVISSEYCVLYFLNLICVVEFVVDVYHDPPNWMQCIFQLRLVAILLFGLVLSTLLVAPSLVMTFVEGAGIRLTGGTLGQVPVIGPIIAVISAFTFLHSLESRVRSAFFFIAGIGGTLATQSRGADISLVIVLIMMVLAWGGRRRRSAYFLASGLLAFVLVVGVLIGYVGADRIWNVFNRGEDTENLITASGRTGVWKDQIAYCLSHPQGMGYIAGVRSFRRRDYSANLHAALTNIGGTDNSYMQTLTDAGWLAIGFYLWILAKTVSLGWRSSKRGEISRISPADLEMSLALRCALFVLFFCLIEQMESSMFVIPMWGPFYFQNILIAIILGASANAILLSRNRNTPIGY